MKPLIVVAIGGNALIEPGRPVDVASQRSRISESARVLAALAEDHRLVITHGSGPQVGVLGLQASTGEAADQVPLDVLDAESMGLIGHLLTEGLSAHLDPATIAVLMTRVEVDAGDPGFDAPTKPIGRWYPPEEGHALATAHGWSVIEGPRGVRRVVASPAPIRIVEIAAIGRLVDAGHVVIAGGGGGIPVVATDHGLIGVEAVVDKDLTSALIAIELGADRFVVLTDVDAIYRDYDEPEAQAIGRTTAADLRTEVFPPGTMGPKVDAVCWFAERTGNAAAIGAFTEAAAVIAGTSGTTVTP